MKYSNFCEENVANFNSDKNILVRRAEPWGNEL
jgi:hypothetical protein